MMEELSRMFLAFLSKNATVTVVILAVLLARLFLRKMPKKYSYFLWAIVGIRMLFDLPFASKFSIFNLFRGLSGRTSTAERVLSSGQDVTDTIGISGISNVKNAANTAVTAGNTFHSSAAASSAALIMSQRILGIAGLIWLIGIIVFLAYGIFSYVKCRILVRTAVLANDVSRNESGRSVRPDRSGTGSHVSSESVDRYEQSGSHYRTWHRFFFCNGEHSLHRGESGSVCRDAPIQDRRHLDCL